MLSKKTRKNKEKTFSLTRIRMFVELGM